MGSDRVNPRMPSIFAVLHEGIDYAKAHPGRLPVVVAARLGAVPSSLYEPGPGLRFAED